MARTSKRAHLSDDDLALYVSVGGTSTHPLSDMLAELRRRSLVPPAVPTGAQTSGGHTVAMSRKLEPHLWRLESRARLVNVLVGANLAAPLLPWREQLKPALTFYREQGIKAPGHYAWKQKLARWVAILKDQSRDAGGQVPDYLARPFLQIWYAVRQEVGFDKGFEGPDTVLAWVVAATDRDRSARQKDRRPSESRQAATDTDLRDAASGAIVYDDLPPWEARREKNRRKQLRYRAKVRQYRTPH